jgi:tetratricopeptide (TPR) repeat protein/tRNA A-37 threonylcarbamoyl transferase component Bud32
MGGDKPRGQKLLRLAHARGLLSTTQLDLCLSAGETAADEAVRRGFVDREDLECLGLARFLAPDADESAPEPPLPSPESAWSDVRGRRFGRYVLEEKIGEGASAYVILAHDSKLNREVALKILKESAAAAPSHLERFTREARAMARLRHPNIVAVHDIGCEEGWYFFAMDLVRGRPLSELLRERRPTLQQTLGILEKIARACHFAHEHGVIHRDLKPGNILVDDALEPFVTDFGIARLDLEKERLTHTGTILGTAHYMSPEHITGDPDRIEPRSDVFSLGAIAFEAVSGRLAFDGRSLVSIFSAISSEDPPRLRSIDRTIPPDVEAVVIKALEKDISRRYLTALALAEDFSRLREGLPIKATRVSTILLLTRRLRKHRWTAGSIALAAAALAALAAFGVIQAVRRGDDESRGDRETDLEKKLGYYERAGAADKADAIRRQLEAVREQARSLEWRKAVRERLEPRLARARDRVEEARRLRGERSSERAGEIASEAARELRSLLDEQPDWAEAWVCLARAHEIAGRRRQAREVLDEAVQTTGGAALVFIERARLNLTAYSRRRGLPATNYVGRRVYIGEPPAETDDLAALRLRIEEDIARIRASGFEFARKHESLLEGGLLVLRGEFERAEESLTEALDRDPFEILAWHYRAVSRYMRSRFQPAEEDWTAALGLSLAEAEHALYRGFARQALQNLDGALEDFQRAARMDPLYASAWNSIGNVQLARRRYRDALQAFDRAIELSPSSGSFYSNRANVHYQRRDYDRAIEDYDRALEAWPRYASGYSNRGNAWRAKGDLARALADHDRAVKLQPRSANLWTNRAGTLLDLGRVEEAVENAARAIEADPDYPQAHLARGNARLRFGDLAGAVEDLERHAALVPRSVGTHLRLGELYGRLGRPAPAVEHYERAVELGARRAPVLVALADARREAGDFARAVDEYTRAIELDRRSAAAWRGRAIARSRSGDPGGAIRDLDEAVGLDPTDAQNFYERGLAHLQSESWDEAARDLRRAVEIGGASWPLRERAEAALHAAEAGRER